MTGKELRYLLVVKDIKPSQLAEHLGVSRSTVSRLLSGERTISDEYEDKIMQLVGDDYESTEQKFKEIVGSMKKAEKIQAIKYILETL